MSSIESLLDELGGFGKFQLLMTVSAFINVFAVAWSMLQMSFAGLVPDFYCLIGKETTPQNGTLNTCTANSTFASGGEVECETYLFTGSSLTIINEWNLVCDMKWVKATVTSIQMAGVLVGAALAGQMADIFGRKTTLYLFALFHSLINIATAFSVSWEMFAVCRFFIGLGIGAVLVAVYPYPLEFLPTKWRAYTVGFPQWVIGVSLFSLAALLVENWSYLHIACGVLGFVCLIGFFFVPESLRFLTVKGRLEEAQATVAHIARLNNRPVPEKTLQILQAVYEEEKKVRDASQKYTYLDILRPWKVAKITLIFCFHWFSMACIYYGISFGVSNLAGNIYLNIFLLAAVELPSRIISVYFVNRIGRKWTCLFYLIVGTVAAFGCFLAQLFVPEESRGASVTALSLVSKMAVGSAWAIISVWGTEFYPTVSRNLGYGATNTVARIGGIVAPFLLNFDDMLVGSYVIIGCLLVADIVLALLTPDTKGRILPETLESVIKENKQDVSVSMETKPDANGLKFPYHEESLHKVVSNTDGDDDKSEVYVISKADQSNPCNNDVFKEQKQEHKDSNGVLPDSTGTIL